MLVDDAVAPRDDRAVCPSGKSFYSCVGNKFRGCCSTDPCDLPECPDKGPLGIRTGGGGSGQGKETESKDISDDASTFTEGDKHSQTTSETQTTSKKTDSGITHTIPNHSVVTVTRHTLVFSEAPSPPPTPSSDTATLTEEPSTNAASATATGARPGVTGVPYGPDGDNQGITLSSGTVVGIAVGGVIFSAILLVVLIAWRRRRRNRREDEAVAFQGIGGGENGGEKGQQPMSAHTTGTQASSSDPFGPFGGRADRPQSPHRPPSGAVEMDGTGMAPVELPAEPATLSSAATAYSRPAVQSYQPYGGLYTLPESPAADPRANLNAIRTDSGHAGYVNHWNQWRAVGSPSGSGSGSGGGGEQS
ncbi:Uncharacterized protein TPAR_08493 [Tolypocladium paradoxum]|uniref:Uncharacterized protein n=1 Tax=Tolypocladium paradoxum TaxID=94208 RepID=A0A2S4KM97_9HYPO|nr:Uncharacterized protein TPAR_08493 [Tolypocladium paradoxum]